MKFLIVYLLLLVLIACRVEVESPAVTPPGVAVTAPPVNPDQAFKVDEPYVCPLVDHKIPPGIVDPTTLYEKMIHPSEEALEQGYTQVIQLADIQTKDRKHIFNLEDSINPTKKNDELFVAYITVQKNLQRAVNHLDLKFFNKNKIVYEIQADHVLRDEQNNDDLGYIANVVEIYHGNPAAFEDRSKEKYSPEEPFENIFQAKLFRISDKSGFAIEEFYKLFVGLEKFKLYNGDESSFALPAGDKYAITMFDPGKYDITYPNSFPVISSQYIYQTIPSAKIGAAGALVHPMNVFQGINMIINKNAKDDIVYFEPQMSTVVNDGKLKMEINQIDSEKIELKSQIEKAPIEYDWVTVFVDEKLAHEVKFEKNIHLELDIDENVDHEVAIYFYQQNESYKADPILTKKLKLEGKKS